MRIGHWLAVIAALTAAAAPAAATCGGTTTLLMPISFDSGSAAIAPGLAARIEGFALEYGSAAQSIDSVAVTVMGDLGEGAEFDGASAKTRAADKALAEARLAAIRTELAGLGKPVTETRIRPTRQRFSAEDKARNPMLTDRVRAGIFLSMMVPRAPAKPGEPVPLC